jgi:phenylalanyl-tRNA synthetase alpha chain
MAKDSLSDEVQLIVEALSPIERKVLPNLSENAMSLKEVSDKSSVDTITGMRALEFLKNKNLVELKIEVGKIIDLDVNGIYYLKKHLPERRLLNKLLQVNFLHFKDVEKGAGLSRDEGKIAIGVLKKKALIEIKEGRIVLNAGSGEVAKKSLEELFLEKLPLKSEELKDEDKLAFENLKTRKNIIKIDDDKNVFAKLTEQGKKIYKNNLDSDLIEQLTPKILKSNSWKGKKFRRYDLTSPVSKIYGGKRHFVNQATEYAKNIWLDMGFEEMGGDMVVSGFWNFDALFTAQDHPVRDMQDTFFIKDLKAKLPESEDKKDVGVVGKVKAAHEGKIAGSKGWQSNWNEEDAKKVLLRTHTTVLSAKKLKEIAENLEENVPVKYFALGKCFRNETVDWSHGFEFNQSEGIVIDENANFRQLLGYLKEFYKKMGYEKIRIRPAHFPYTEPSLEIDVFHPVHKKWVEIGGAGLFRPEVTIPFFGKHIPVLAWGPGFDRIIMEFFEINDLREMYSNDLTKLRNMKFWRK